MYCGAGTRTPITASREPRLAIRRPRNERPRWPSGDAEYIGVPSDADGNISFVSDPIVVRQIKTREQVRALLETWDVRSSRSRESLGRSPCHRELSRDEGSGRRLTTVALGDTTGRRSSVSTSAGRHSARVPGAVRLLPAKLARGQSAWRDRATRESRCRSTNSSAAAATAGTSSDDCSRAESSRTGATRCGMRGLVRLPAEHGPASRQRRPRRQPPAQNLESSSAPDCHAQTENFAGRNRRTA